jgi:hypothetical protein
MRKAKVAKRYRGNKSARALTVVARPNSGPLTKANDDPDARRVVSGKTLVESVKTLGELRRKAGISGAATIVGFAICLHAAGHASLILTLLAVAGFALIMILLQWFERWTKLEKDTSAPQAACEMKPWHGGARGSN